MKPNPELHKTMRACIKAGDAEGLRQTLAENSDAANMITPFGTWLHVAASFGKLEIVRMLLENGLDINARGGVANAGALHRAASDGHGARLRSAGAPALSGNHGKRGKLTGTCLDRRGRNSPVG